MNINLEQLFLILPGLILSITIHEFAHAWTACLCGDRTGANQGRVSLNPIDHFDPFGLLFIIISLLHGIGFGWGKPVPVNPAKLKYPSRDIILVTAAGPLSNFFLAFTTAYIFKLLNLFISVPHTVELFCYFFIFQNVALGIFNLSPVPPLDGFTIISGLLPYEISRHLERIRCYGFIPLLIFIYSPLYKFITIPIFSITNFLLMVGDFHFKT